MVLYTWYIYIDMVHQARGWGTLLCDISPLVQSKDVGVLTHLPTFPGFVEAKT